MKDLIKQQNQLKDGGRFCYIKKYISYCHGFTLVEVVAVMVLMGASIMALTIFFGPAAKLFAGRHRVLMQQDADFALSAINLNIREAQSVKIADDGALVLSESGTYSHRYYLESDALWHRVGTGTPSKLLPLSSWYGLSALSFTQVYSLSGATTNVTLTASEETTMIASTTAISRYLFYNTIGSNDPCS